MLAFVPEFGRASGQRDTRIVDKRAHDIWESWTCSCSLWVLNSTAGWIDINLTITQTTVPLLFSLLSDASLPIRLATSLALMRILAKGLKEPGDKIQLIKVLSLGQVIDALETKTRSEQVQRGEDTDEGEESYREALGKLLNQLGTELVKLIDVRFYVSQSKV